MSEVKQITSLQNSLIKKVLHLKDKARERKKTGKFVVEGLRELQLAVKGGYEIETLLFYDDIISFNQLLNVTNVLSVRPEFISISKQVYQKMAYRETTEGVLAIVKAKTHALAELKIKNKTPLLLIVEAPEKPGNLGALLRTADAANLDAVIIANPKGDLYNPNTIRSSVGCIFTNQIGIGTNTEVIEFLKENSINIFSAALTASKKYTQVDFTAPSAIVMGTEATGLTAEWLENSSQNIIIPMQGEIDSMNLSVAAAILIFEAVRQRDF